MKRPWFKAKSYGYGWYPATWEGWVVMAGFVGAVSLAAVLWFRWGMGLGTLAGYLTTVILLTAGLIALSAVKGEKARWR